MGHCMLLYIAPFTSCPTPKLRMHESSFGCNMLRSLAQAGTALHASCKTSLTLLNTAATGAGSPGPEGTEDSWPIRSAVTFACTDAEQSVAFCMLTIADTH